MIYWVPNESEPDWEKKYEVTRGQYLCDKCKKPQNIRTLTGYLSPCPNCGCKAFWK